MSHHESEFDSVLIARAFDSIAIFPVGCDEAAHAEGVILAAARQGHSKAQSLVVSRFHQPLVCLVHRMGASYETAQDIAQETLLRALDPNTGWKKTDRTWPWLKTIARNKYIDVYRKNTPITGTSFDNAIKSAEGRNDIGETDDRLVVSDALAKLPAKQRETVCDHDLNGLTLQEIATKTGKTIGIVNATRTAALKKLKSLISL